MSVSAKGRASGALLVMAALAIGGGLAVTGGPGTGRAERRDETRYDDMRRMVDLANCLTAAGDRVPASLATSEDCPSPARMEDPFTGQPYRYEVIDDASYRVCVGFELPVPAHRLEYEDYDAERGCFVERIRVDPAGPANLAEPPAPAAEIPSPAP